jgi:gas vesicle protein
MTKLKTHDLIKLRQIDREKFEKVIKEYADYFGDLLKDDERKREIFKKDPNAELICEFISKLFRLTIKSAEKEVLRRWFADAKSKNKDIESLQGIGNDKMRGHLLNLSFWQLNDIIKESEYFGDLDIAEKLLDIEDITKKTESILESFKGRLDKIDNIAEKSKDLQKTSVEQQGGVMEGIKEGTEVTRGVVALVKETKDLVESFFEKEKHKSPENLKEESKKEQ